MILYICVYKPSRAHYTPDTFPVCMHHVTSQSRQSCPQDLPRLERYVPRDLDVSTEIVFKNRSDISVRETTSTPQLWNGLLDSAPSAQPQLSNV